MSGSHVPENGQFVIPGQLESVSETPLYDAMVTERNSRLDIARQAIAEIPAPESEFISPASMHIIEKMRTLQSGRIRSSRPLTSQDVNVGPSHANV